MVTPEYGKSPRPEAHTPRSALESHLLRRIGGAVTRFMEQRLGHVTLEASLLAADARVRQALEYQFPLVAEQLVWTQSITNLNAKIADGVMQIHNQAVGAIKTVASAENPLVQLIPTRLLEISAAAVVAASSRVESRVIYAAGAVSKLPGKIAERITPQPAAGLVYQG